MAAGICRHFRIWVIRLLLHVVVALLAIGYGVAGALLFESVESSAPASGWMQPLTNMAAVRQETLEKLYRHAHAHERSLSAYQALASRSLLQHEHELLERQRAARERNRGDPWTLSKSALYAFGILTSNGYGDVTPRSRASKVATLAYLALGVPLFVLYVIYFGSSVASHLQRVCRHLGACFCSGGSGEPLCCPLLLAAALLCAHVAAGTAALSRTEHAPGAFDAFYFIVQTLSTLGLGDVALGQFVERNTALFYSYFALGYALVGATFVLGHRATASRFRSWALRLGLESEEAEA